MWSWHAISTTVRGGGCVVGRADERGQMSGIRIAYIYPGKGYCILPTKNLSSNGFCFADFRTALVGHFEDGLMKAAQVASLKTIIDDGGIKVPIFTEPRGPYYKVWPINQFHSIDISQSVKRCFFSNTQSRFASVVFESVLEPPCLAHRDRWCPCICSSGSKEKGWGCLEGRCVS